MNMTSRFAVQTARNACLSLLAVATLVACGGGGGGSGSTPVPPGSAPASTQSTSISATPSTGDATVGPAPMQMSFTAASPRGNIASFEWDFKDNSPVSMGQTVQHTFMAPGAYNVTLTVRDANGNFNRAGIMVTVQAGGTQCSAAPTEFTTKVWPSMSGVCTLCHVSGGVASGTGLVLSTGTVLQNYNIVRDYALKNDSLLLSKTVGLPTHSGGTPFVSTSDQRYMDLAALVPIMKQSCASTPIDGPAMGQFWNGVTFAPDQKVLARAATLFAGRNPTAAEESAVAAGGTPVLRQTIRDYMQGPAFQAFLDEVGETWFLTRGATIRGNNMGYNATDWPSAINVINNTNLAANELNRFVTGSRVEPIELMKYIVNNDRGWTEMVSGNYTVVNAIVAQYMQAQVNGTFANPLDDTVFLPAVLPSQRLGGNREHAGVLSTQAWLSRFPTTPTNRNRHRTYIMAKQFLATDISALAVRPIDDGGTFKIPTMENPACAACHDTMDPMAAGFMNWQENNRYLPFKDSTGKDHALPGSYRSTSYPKDATNQPYYKLGDAWFRDEKAPGYYGTPMPGGVTGNPMALQWLGAQVAADQRYAMGAVHFWYKAVFGREPLKAPLDSSTPENANRLSAYNAQNEVFQAIAGRFQTNRGSGAFNVKDLLTDLVMSSWGRAEAASGLTAGRMIELGDLGAFNMLNPVHLNRKLTTLVGQNFTDFNNPYAGFGLNYGDFDGINRTQRAQEHTMMQSIAIDRLVATRSCSFTQNDFTKTQASRLLFPKVALADTPATAAGATAIQENIKYLHKWLWKEDVAVSDAEVQRTYKLFNDVWADRATAPARPVNCAYNNTNDPNYTGRTWAAVVAYMLGDPKFLYE
ncbi:MAG: PKD domain-containing protein [Burkholderiaceae bacterium]